MWKTIEYFPNYEINEEGQVRNKFTKHLKKTHINKPDGYIGVYLNKNGQSHRRFIHRLLAIAFIPNHRDPIRFNQVHHIDGNKYNNSLSNLQWVSQNENLSGGLTMDKQPLPDNDDGERIIWRHDAKALTKSKLFSEQMEGKK